MMNTAFLNEAPAGTETALQIFACAESLTDELATKLYEIAPVPGVRCQQFLAALSQADFVEPRNSEWSFPPSARDTFRNLGKADESLVRAAHMLLLQTAQCGDPALAGSRLPSYLFTPAGKGYHSAYIGEVSDALAYYSAAAEGDYSGAQWLASKFVDEQIQTEQIPSDNVATLFLRAIVLFREGSREAALPLFFRIVKKNEESRPSAFAHNIAGNSLVNEDRDRAEMLLRRGLEISKAIHDVRGIEIGSHSLAQVIDRDKPDEAESLYVASIESALSRGDEYAAAKRKNSFGDHLTSRGRFKQAVKVLGEAIDFFQGHGYEAYAGRALNTLARAVARQGRSSEAEDLYRESIRIAKKYKDEKGLEVRLFGLGSLLASHAQRRQEAVAVLQDALRLNERRGNRIGIDRIRRLIRRIEGA